MLIFLQENVMLTYQSKLTELRKEFEVSDLLCTLTAHYFPIFIILWVTLVECYEEFISFIFYLLHIYMSPKVKSLLYAITLYWKSGISPKSLKRDHRETTVSSANYVRGFVIIAV
jgi:hypothetical protein